MHPLQCQQGAQLPQNCSAAGFISASAEPAPPCWGYAEHMTWHGFSVRLNCLTQAPPIQHATTVHPPHSSFHSAAMVGQVTMMEEDGPRLESVFSVKKPRVLQGQNRSELQIQRLSYQPILPKVLRGEARLPH